MLSRTIKIVKTIINIQHIRTNEIKNSSEGDNMSDIESVTSIVMQLDTNVVFWNNLRYWCVGVTALFTVLSFLAFWISGNKTDALSKSKDTLQKLKIEKVKADSREEVERLRTDAGKEIALLNSETAKAKSEIAKAQAESGKANEKAESEKLERMLLESELAPRTLEQMHSAKTLSKFKGVSVILESISESEPWRLTGQIAATLDMAGWKVLPGMKRMSGDGQDHFFDGVAITVNTQQGVADELVTILKQNKVSAHVRPSINKVPPNTVLIRVGLKPHEYFDRDRKDNIYGNMLYK